MLLSGAFFALGSGAVQAQNNTYRINDALYPLFQQAYAKCNEKEGLVLADSLRRKAIAMGDHEAELRAMNIPVLHYFYSDYSFSRYEKEVIEPLMQKAKEYGSRVNYYFAVANAITFLGRHNQTREAFDYAHRYRDIAEKEHYRSGYLMCQRMLGNLHEGRGEYVLALNTYNQALEYARENNMNTNSSVIYQSIMSCYRYIGEYKMMLKVAKDALNKNLSQRARYMIRQNLCYAYYLSFENDDKVIALADSLRQERPDHYIGLAFMPAALEIARKTLLGGKDREEALQMIDKMKAPKREKLILYTQYYSRLGDYQTERKYLKQLIEMNHNRNNALIMEDRKRAEQELGSIHLETQRQQREEENAQLQLANNKLLLDNSTIELGNVRTATRIASLANEKSNMQMETRRLANMQVSAHLKAQRQRIEADRRIIATRDTRILYLVLLAGLLVVLVGYYSQRSRIGNRRLRRSNEQLRQRNVELGVARERSHEAERMKTQFIQNMSHEIRTPLNAIAGFSQVLKTMDGELSREEKKTIHKMITDNSALLTALVDDILDLAALESGKYALCYSEVRVNDLCREVLETVRGRLASGVKLRFHSTVIDDYTIQTDARRTMQVLINMLTNAEKNTTRGTITLLVSLNMSKGFVTFAVEDTGVGVPKEKMKAIFQRFNKLDNKKQGTGLGLDICRTIAEKLGGEIDIDPDYSPGARFWFTIPAKS